VLSEKLHTVSRKNTVANAVKNDGKGNATMGVYKTNLGGNVHHEISYNALFIKSFLVRQSSCANWPRRLFGAARGIRI
jgi:hypothetical protein